MKERTLASKFRSELKAWGGENIHVQVLMDARNTKLKPYDSYAVYKHKFYAFEFKLIRGGTVNGNVVTNGQLEGLSGVAKAGGKAFVMLFFADPKYKKVMVAIPFKEWAYDLFIRMSDNGLWVPIRGARKAMKIKDMIYSGCAMRILNRDKFDGITRWDFDRLIEIGVYA